MQQSRPLLSLLASVALCATASSALADQILVAGADGQILVADARARNFAPLAAATSSAVTAMASDGQRLFVADEAGQLRTLDLVDGALLQSYALPSVASALAVYGEQLFVASGASVLRLDAGTGQVLEQRPVQTQVNALALYRDDLFAAGTDGAVYTAKAGSGDFTYFTCFCFTDVRAMTVVGHALYVGDRFGFVAQVNLRSGNIMNAFGAAAGFNTMSAQAGDLLMHNGGGVVSRVNRRTGQGEDYYFSPVAIEAMLTLRESPPMTVEETLATPIGIRKR